MLFWSFSSRATDGLIIYDVDIEAKLNMNILTASVIDENFRNMHIVQGVKRLGFTPRRISFGKRFRSSFEGERDLVVN